MNTKLLSKNNEMEKEGNLYHNNLHGADVFQAVLYLTTTYEDIGGSLSSLDLFSLLFAAYIHDFNHPGLNTTYVVSDWPHSGISSTFGSESPLEKHHLAMTFNLMRDEEEFNFLSSLSLTDLNYFRKIVTECVLATDLAKSMSWLSSSRITIKDTNDVGKELERKIIKMQLAIKCADVGHPSRKLELHLLWSDRIKEEFFQQGDKEKSKGRSISALCDRNVPISNYPSGQIGFINYVSRPIFTFLNELIYENVPNDNDKPWLKNLNSNVTYWEEEKKRS